MGWIRFLSVRLYRSGVLGLGGIWLFSSTELVLLCGGPMVEIAGSYVLALKRFIAFIWSGLVS